MVKSVQQKDGGAASSGEGVAMANDRGSIGKLIWHLMLPDDWSGPYLMVSVK